MAVSRSTPWLQRLMILAAVLIGLLSGGNFDRSTVAMPAWEKIGSVAWADFSRQADLGNGRSIYPALAFGGTICCAAALALFAMAGRQPRKAGMPIVSAAALMTASIPISLKAVPYMMSLTRLKDGDLQALNAAFAGFEFWGRWQGILHIGAFVATLVAIAALSKDQAVA